MEDTNMIEQRYVLEVDRFSSRCGFCGQSAFPDEEKHTCGVRFTHITPTCFYEDVEKSVKSLRPDLIYIG